MKTRHIYWFAYFNKDEPSVRYRGLYALQYMQAHHGISWDIVYPGYDLYSILSFLHVYGSALFSRRADSVIVFQKIYRPGIYTAALKFLLWCRPSRTVYDIDDAEYLRYPDEVIRHFMCRCSVVAVGSEALDVYAKQYNPATVLLTSPVIEQPCRRKERNAPLRIGWIGYYGAHRANLHQLLFPAVSSLDRPVTLMILGVKSEEEASEIRNYFLGKEHIQVEAPVGIEWLDEESVYERIATMDIGVAPLLDTAFNRAKSAFKLKQCLSCGVPVIGSPVGENRRFLLDGVNGMIAEDAAAFLTALQKICDMPQDRYEEMSKAAVASHKAFDMEHYYGAMAPFLGAVV